MGLLDLVFHLCFFIATKVGGEECVSWVHSSVVKAADCRSAGPWFKSGCALSGFSWFGAAFIMEAAQIGAEHVLPVGVKIPEVGLQPTISSLGGRRLIH